MQILSSIPLFKGLEVRKENEFDVASVLIGIFNKIENESKNADGSLNRGTHAVSEAPTKPARSGSKSKYIAVKVVPPLNRSDSLTN